MIVTRLKLANVRAVQAAEFTFKPGFNLIIGVNGVGKTTVLDSLAACLAPTSRHISGLKRGAVFGLVDSDIRVSKRALTVQTDVSHLDKTYSYVVHLPRAGGGESGHPDGPARSEFVGDVPSTAGEGRALRPIAVLFSTRRAVPTDRAPTNAAASGGIAAAFAEAFSPRQLRLAEFSAWMRTQSVLSAELGKPSPLLLAFEEAVRRFLPGYTDLRVTDERSPRLLIRRSEGEIPVRLLSDGERGALALVLDLTRRLAQANPGLEDPAAEGPGVVLIDEIDLHLHPKWQREIVRNLPDAFPKLQFIATTHSPQVIGEVGHERIQVMGRGPVFSPTHSFGVDASRVLEEIMGAPARSPAVQDLLDKVSKVIDQKKLDDANVLVADLASKLGEDDAEVIRARTLLDFLGGDE